jgi:heme exporter protein A
MDEHMKLIAEDLHVSRGEWPVFSGVNLSVISGAAAIVTGANGTGKSTLLKTVAGFLQPERGRIVFDDASEGSPGEHCHYLGHENALKSALTASENLAFWQAYLGPGQRIGNALAAIGLDAMENIPAGYLSAGQKRRLAIARLLVSTRPVWLLDEPASSLDDRSIGLLSDIIRNHLHSGGIVIAATHQKLGISGAANLDMNKFSMSQKQ